MIKLYTNKNGRQPYNNRFNLTSLGRHGLCLRKARAGDPTHPSVPAGRSGLVRRLIGRYTDPRN